MTSVDAHFDVEIDELDDLRENRAPALASAVRPSRHFLSPLDGQGWSTPDSTAYSTFVRRVLRTTGPFILGDWLSLSLCGLISEGILNLSYPVPGHVGWLAAVALLPLSIAYWLSDLYSEIWIHPLIEFRQLTRVNTLGLFAAAVAVGIVSPPLSVWCAVAWLTTVVLVPLLRTVVRRVCVYRSWWGYPTLVIGHGVGALDLAHLIKEVPRSGLRPVLLTDPNGQCRSSFIPVVNDPASLESLLRREGILHAVVSLPECSAARSSELLDRFSGLVPHLIVMSDATTLPALWGASRNYGSLSGTEVRNGVLLGTLQISKRLIDVTVAASVLFVGLPLLLAIALGTRLTSPGPLFFAHTRIGRHGRFFRAWKFRTMRTDGDAVLKDHFAESPAAHSEFLRDQKLQDDPRVTRFGRLLRRTSFDELPQLWNVLKGDMSLVGPRPIVQDEIPRYGEVFRQITTVKPGITGLWQVSGRNNISYRDRVLLDQFYIRHWSPWLDVYILAKTVVVLINREGAY